MLIGTLIEAVAESVISIRRTKKPEKASPRVRNAVGIIGFIILLIIAIGIGIYTK